MWLEYNNNRNNKNVYNVLCRNLKLLKHSKCVLFAGITLRSLGGVFIATLVGLGIAMIVLAFEVYFHKKDQKNAVQDISRGSGGNAGHLQTNFNSSFGTGGDKTTMQVGGRILTVSSKNTEKAGFGGQFD